MDGANTAAAALLSLRMLLHQPPSTTIVINHHHHDESEARMPCARPDSVLPVDLLAQCFVHLSSFQDMAAVNRVCKMWRQSMEHSLAYRSKLSFAGSRVEDHTVARLVSLAVSLLDLDMSAGRWGCRITNTALCAIACSNCCPNLRSVSLWGVTAITDDGLVQLVSKARSLENLNVGGTFITDVSLLAISAHCKQLKVLNLWGCKYVTFHGLLHLVQGCLKLQALNLWGMKLGMAAMQGLLSLNPQLNIKPTIVST